MKQRNPKKKKRKREVLRGTLTCTGSALALTARKLAAAAVAPVLLLRLPPVPRPEAPILSSPLPSRPLAPRAAMPPKRPTLPQTDVAAYSVLV